MPTSEFGIRALYPRLPIKSKARAYLALCRPFTLTAPLFGIFVAASLSVSTEHSTWPWMREHWMTLIHGTATLLLAQIGSNWVNQATDKEDAINKRERPIPRGIVMPDEALVLGHIMWFAAILRAATLNAAFGVLVTLIILLSMGYSEPPLRFKRIPWVNNVTIALARGLLGIVAAWTITSPWTATEPWIVGSILFLFLVGATTAKDYGDATGDAANGVRTLVVHYGARKASLASVPWILTPIVTMPLAVRLGVSVPTPMLVLVAVGVVTFAIVLFSDRRVRPNKFTEGSLAWLAHYGCVVLLMLAFGLNGFLSLVR